MFQTCFTNQEVLLFLLAYSHVYSIVRCYRKGSLKCACVYFLGLNVSLQLLHGDMEQIRKDYMRLFTRNVSITKRLGFSDIIIPGGIITSCCHYAAFFLHHITIEFMFIQIKAPALRHLLSFNDIIMVMWPLGGICSNGLIMSLCSKLIALRCEYRLYSRKIKCVLNYHEL